VLRLAAIPSGAAEAEASEEAEAIPSARDLKALCQEEVAILAGEAVAKGNLDLLHPAHQAGMEELPLAVGRVEVHSADQAREEEIPSEVQVVAEEAALGHQEVVQWASRRIHLAPSLGGTERAVKAPNLSLEVGVHQLVAIRLVVAHHR
jgi:hypothetical protein